jgi:hypothetical protein
MTVIEAHGRTEGNPLVDVAVPADSDRADDDMPTMRERQATADVCPSVDVNPSKRHDGAVEGLGQHGERA